MATEVIELDKLKSNYITLSPAVGSVRVVGNWKGDRLVFKNASKKYIALDGCRIESERLEPDRNAIAFEGDIKEMTLVGKNGAEIVYGGIAFWGWLTDCIFDNLVIKYANIGFHAATDVSNINVTIMGCKFLYPQREAIYFGPSYKQKIPSRNIVIANCEIEGAGWDGIQVNANPCYIRHNRIVGAGLAGENWQNYAITVQPGSLVFHHDNEISGCENKIQILDSRAFKTRLYN